jgi:hypothetical protein
MRRAEYESDAVGIELGSRRGKPGWEEVRIVYNLHNHKHLAQVDAVIDSLLKARRAIAQDDDAPAAEGPCERPS